MPNQYTNDLQYSYYGLTWEEFHKTHKPGKGLFSKHRNLCLGKDQFGNPLYYTECLICAKDLSSNTIKAVYTYHRTYGQDLTRTYTIHDIHREFCTHNYPDLDMNQDYGLLFTRQNVVDHNVDERIAGYWQNFIKVPATIYHDVRDIRDYYPEAFSNFFGVDVISLHGHVSDVANPFLLTSLILHLSVENMRGSTENKNSQDVTKNLFCPEM